MRPLCFGNTLKENLVAEVFSEFHGLDFVLICNVHCENLQLCILCPINGGCTWQLFEVPQQMIWILLWTRYLRFWLLLNIQRILNCVFPLSLWVSECRLLGKCGKYYKLRITAKITQKTKSKRWQSEYIMKRLYVNIWKKLSMRQVGQLYLKVTLLNCEANTIDWNTLSHSIFGFLFDPNTHKCFVSTVEAIFSYPVPCLLPVPIPLSHASQRFFLISFNDSHSFWTLIPTDVFSPKQAAFSFIWFSPSNTLCL